jgi:uncharacterized delta-60 repeat protein
MKKQFLGGVAVAAALVAGTAGVASAAGEPRLDPAYGTNGVAPAELNTSEGDRFSGVVVSRDGRAYAAGYVTRARDQRLAVARLGAKGGLDRRFGRSGTAEVNLAEGVTTTVEQARAVAVQSNGKIVTTAAFERAPGATGNAGRDTDVAVVRFNVDGSLDDTFGDDGVAKVSLGDGKAIANNGDVTDAVYGIAVTANDKIVVHGTRANLAEGRSDADFVVLGLTANGGVDRSFATNGQAVVNVGGDSARQILVQPDGKIVATGYANDGGVVQPVAIRLLANGRFDATFGTNGVATMQVLSGVAESYEIAQQGSNYVLAGYGRGLDATKVDLIVYRFTGRGTWDRSFGTNGITRIDVDGDDDRGRDLAVLPDGRVLVVGSGKPTATNLNAMMVLLGRDGARVRSFGTNGVLLTDLGGPNDSWYGVALAPDRSRALVVGYRGADTAGLANDSGVVARLVL